MTAAFPPPPNPPKKGDPPVKIAQGVPVDHTPLPRPPGSPEPTGPLKKDSEQDPYKLPDIDPGGPK